MRRVLAVSAAVLLVIAMLSPGTLADRGGRGGGMGNGSGQETPGQAPSGDQDQDRVQDKDQDCEDCDKGPVQDRNHEDKEITEEDTTVPSDPKGPQGNGKGPDETKPDHGKGPENAPGQAVSAEVHSRFTTEGESTENTRRVQVELQIEDPEESEDSVEDVDSEEPDSLAHRIWAWQRALANSTKHLPKINNGAKPFMMVGQPVIGADGSLAGVDLWKGNRLSRDYYDPEVPTPISVTVASEIRLVSLDGVTVCDPAATATCLADWLEANPDAYISVWGRVETVDGEAVFVASRITVTVPNMECDDCVTPTPTTVGTMPAPTATPTAQGTLPAPTATPTTQGTLPAPTATPTTQGTLPAPTLIYTPMP